VTTVVGTKCGGVGPAPRPDASLAAVAATAYEDAAAAWAATQPSVALDATWRIIRETNEYLQTNEPWKLEPGPEVDAIMGNALEALRVVAILASPAMPSACDAVWARIGLEGSPREQRLPDAAKWGGYPGGRTITAGDPLFPRIKS
jgi:methionyl-tRNA synthetase